MSISRKFGIIALVLWISIAVMAYTTVWCQWNQTTTTLTPEHQSIMWADNGSIVPYTIQAYNTTTTNDIFPHDQVWTSAEITVIPAIVFSVACGVTYEEKRNDD